MQHAFATEQAWKDYGTAKANYPNINEEFNFLWANLVKHEAGFDHHDRARFLKIFMDAANAAKSLRVASA